MVFLKKITAIVFPDRPAAFERRSHEGGGRKGRLPWDHLGDCIKRRKKKNITLYRVANKFLRRSPAAVSILNWGIPDLFLNLFSVAVVFDTFGIVAVVVVLILCLLLLLPSDVQRPHRDQRHRLLGRSRHLRSTRNSQKIFFFAKYSAKSFLSPILATDCPVHGGGATYVHTDGRW